MVCKHVAWLEAIEDRGIGSKKVINTGRLERVSEELPDGCNQTPRVVHLIGTRSKDCALKYLFPNNNFGRQYEKGNINLRADNASINAASPLFIADSNPFRGFAAKQSRSTCHPSHSSTISWMKDGDLITDILLSRLTFPFSDLVCVFAEDFTTLETVARRILSWIAIQDCVQVFRPRLLIITPEAGPLAALQDEDFRLMILSSDNNPREKFSAITIFRLVGEYLSPVARYQRLKDQIYELTAQSLLERKERGYAFSALHLAECFNFAVVHTAQTGTEPLNLITASRYSRPSLVDHTEYAKSFLKHALDVKSPYEGIASFLASCLLVDAYPPRMHSFLPQGLFDLIYHEGLLAMLNQYLDPRCALHLMSLIATDFVEYHKIVAKGKTSVEVHRQNMERLAHFFAWYRTNVSCLFCLTGSPERHLSCGHSICDTCIRRFGKGVIGREDRFTVACLFGDKGMITADLKPMTAGVRILSIDGGGSRAVAPLTSCEMMEELMPGCPLHEQVDYGAGSSSGGLIILGYLYKQWNPQKCTQLFLAVVKQCFNEMSNVYGCIRSTLRWLISDGVYDEAILESILKEMFPERLFDHLPNTISGARFALTATSFGNSRWIFGNYNAASPRPRNDYDLVRVEEVDQEVHAWEAARATSAAPIFFKPVRMHSGTYWDGGLVFPDPVKLALFESERLWPESSPDVIISLGTGVQPRAKGGRRSFHRLWAGFMDFLDGQSHARDTAKGLEKLTHGSFFRLNTILQHPIRLDNTADLDKLRNSVYMSPTSRTEAKKVVLALLSSNFYLTLDGKPIFDAGSYHYNASIRCRTDCSAVISALNRLCPSTKRFVTQTEFLGDCSPNDICRMCCRYRKRVTITVRHPSDSVTISIQSGSDLLWKLSAFPQMMSWFEDQESLNCVFGNKYHDIPGALQCPTCTPRRSIPSTPATQRQKRNRTS